jgi:hypothetical protein
VPTCVRDQFYKIGLFQSRTSLQGLSNAQRLPKSILAQSLDLYKRKTIWAQWACPQGILNLNLLAFISSVPRKTKGDRSPLTKQFHLFISNTFLLWCLLIFFNSFGSLSFTSSQVSTCPSWPDWSQPPNSFLGSQFYTSCWSCLLSNGSGWFQLELNSSGWPQLLTYIRCDWFVLTQNDPPLELKLDPGITQARTSWHRLAPAISDCLVPNSLGWLRLLWLAPAGPRWPRCQLHDPSCPQITLTA